MRKPDVPTLAYAAAFVVVAIIFYHIAIGKGKER
jgi:hypothetical protein